MIHFFYTKFDRPICSDLWSFYLKLLPRDMCLESKKYVRWQDQHSFVLGKLLLLECLAKEGIDKNKIHELQYNNFGKPYLNEDIDFNISHSGEYVVCALGKNVRLGVDIENISDINFDDFYYIMTEKQWCDIMGSKNPLETFYRYWTIKESVIKAEEKGLTIPLLDLHVDENVVRYEEKTWYINEFIISRLFCASLATDIRNPIINFLEIDFYSGLKIKHPNLVQLRA